MWFALVGQYGQSVARSGLKSAAGFTPGSFSPPELALTRNMVELRVT
jgi:hypothetical protein